MVTFVFISGGCGGGGGSSDSGGSDDDDVTFITQPVVYEPGEDIIVVSKTIGTTGDTIEAGYTGTPIDGFKIIFPSAALQSDTKISLGYNVGSMTPSGDDWDETVRGTWSGSAIVLEAEVGGESVTDFDIPIEITLPWNGAPYGIIAPYYVEESGRISPCYVTEINDAEQTVTFITYHASNYLTIIPDFDGNKKVSCNFTPSEDGFGIRNFSLSDSKGQCWGMSAFAIWYYNNERERGGKLNSRFDDEQEKTIAQNSQLALIKNAGIPPVEFEEFRRRRTIENNIVNSGPAMILLYQDYWPVIDWFLKDKAHQVVVFGFTTNNSNGDVNFNIYDPNYPGEIRNIRYDDTLGKFDSYDGYSYICNGGVGTFSQVVRDRFAHFVNAVTNP
jgi:hypothetical protein